VKAGERLEPKGKPKMNAVGEQSFLLKPVAKGLGSCPTRASAASGCQIRWSRSAPTPLRRLTARRQGKISCRFRSDLSQFCQSAVIVLSKVPIHLTF